MAEQFVNMQVEQFIRELERKLGAMKSTLNELQTVRECVVSGQSRQDESTRARVRELAQDVGDRAGDLYNMVAVVAVDLQARDAAPPPPSSATDFFGNELRFLQRQVGKAERHLKALFLQPTHTVDLEELRGDNVLTELKSIEQISKHIRKKAVAPVGQDMAE